MSEPAAAAVSADGGHLRVIDEVAGFDVVLCCATDAAETVLASFPGLVSERLCPRAVSGIESEVQPLVAAIQNASGPTLFVICVGEHVDGAQTRRLVEAFSVARGPLHRLLVLEPDPLQPRLLVASVRRGAAGLRRQLTPGASSVDSIRGSVISSKSAEPRAREPDRASVVVSGPERDHVGKIPEHVCVPEGLRRSRPLLQVVPDEAVHERVVDPAADTAELPIVAVSGAIEPASNDTTVAAAESDDPDEAPASLAAASGVRASIDLEQRAIAGPSTMPLGNPMPMTRARPGRSRWVAVAAGMGAAVGLALAAVPDEPQQAAAMSGGLAHLTAREEAMAEPAPRHREPPQQAGTREPPTTPAAHEPIAVAAEPAFTPVGGAAPELPRTLSPLDEAVGQGKLRELDLLLVTQPYRTTSNWRQAATRCRGRSVGGVRGWRLPKGAELRDLFRHQMLPVGVFWTAARVPKAAVPSNLVFNVRARRLVPLAKHENASTVCVRYRL